MKRYGSAMNFFGGPGEVAHKFFMKAPGLKTQRHVNNFAIQIANQYYDIIVTRHALRLLEREQNMIQESSSLQSKILATEQFSRDEDEVAVEFWGKYSLLVKIEVLQSMREGNKIYVSWNKDEKKVKNNNDSYCLDSQLVRVILVKLENLNVNDFLEGYLIKGYTRAMTKTTEGNKIIFYAHPSFQGKRWYD